MINCQYVDSSGLAFIYQQLLPFNTIKHTMTKCQRFIIVVSLFQNSSSIGDR